MILVKYQGANDIDSWYIVVQYDMIVHTVQQLWRQNFGQTSNSQKTAISCPNGWAMPVLHEFWGEQWLRDIMNALYNFLNRDVKLNNCNVYILPVLNLFKET